MKETVQTLRSRVIAQLVAKGKTKAEANSFLDREHNQAVRKAFKARPANFRVATERSVRKLLKSNPQQI